MSFKEWRALEVDEVDEDIFLLGAGAKGKCAKSNLPTQGVKLPADDPSTVGVVSWRWDGEHELQGSRDVFCAVHIAKRVGIKYLFIDVISVDQHLTGESLLYQVVGFSQLYRSVPIIAAYDVVGNEHEWYLEQTVRRPWILSEAKLFQYSPTRTFYFSHVEDVAWQNKEYNQFVKILHRVWRYGFCEMALGIQSRRFNMTSISDLKFIIPEWARIFEVAHEKMSRADYLLTTAIWCQLSRKDFRLEEWSDITRCENSDRYSLRSADILLDGTPIAKWAENYENLVDQHNLLEAFDNAKAAIFSALGIYQYSALGIEPPNEGLELTHPKVEYHHIDLWAYQNKARQFLDFD